MPCANNLNCTSTLMKILSQNLAAHVERTKIWQKSICMKVIPETSPNVLFDFTHKINESGVCSKEKTGFFLSQFWDISREKLYFDLWKFQRHHQNQLFTIIIGFQLVTFFANVWIRLWNLWTAEDTYNQNISLTSLPIYHLFMPRAFLLEKDFLRPMC